MCLLIIEDFQEIFATDNYPSGWIIIFSIAKDTLPLNLSSRESENRSDRRVCVFIGPLSFFPTKVFFRTPKKDGRRRRCDKVTYCLSKMIDKATRGKKLRIPRGELSQDLNGRSRYENRRLISKAFCRASTGKRKRDRQTRFSPGFLFITKTDDSWGLARNPGEMVWTSRERGCRKLSVRMPGEATGWGHSSWLDAVSHGDK